ncbi:MAG: bifunctional oligoribonuclease/PAP phosphatase NrnA [Oscillospiraceae bacterium]|nr:bifunctional oligoribonuclease/PAP phosphatase NrnA [Oscillospiraceae bacterium]
MMKIITTAQTAAFFKENDNFTLICHANPDGDTLGSGYGLCGVLHILGKRARVICDDDPSSRFDFLKETIVPALSEFPPNATEIIVTVDVADIELLGSFKDKYPNIDLCIDHHVSNKNYAARTLLDTDAAACANVVWALIKELICEQELKTKPTAAAIAGAIYTGVSTDTGCFRYSNTSAKTHRVAAELMEYNFNVAKINYLMFEMKTRERISLEMEALSGIAFHFNDRCAMITLTYDMLQGIDPEDASNVSTLPKQIEGVEAGIVLKEKKQGVWKVSVRTGENINAQLLCSALGGGGHIRAAGCTLKGTLETVKSEILKEIEKQLYEESAI